MPTKANLPLTQREVKALAAFLDTGLSISPIVRKGDRDFPALLRIDAKVRGLNGNKP